MTSLQIEDISLAVTSNSMRLINVGDVKPAFWIEDGQQSVKLACKKLL